MLSSRLRCIAFSWLVSSLFFSFVLVLGPSYRSSRRWSSWLQFPSATASTYFGLTPHYRSTLPLLLHTYPTTTLAHINSPAQPMAHVAHGIASHHITYTYIHTYIITQTQRFLFPAFPPRASWKRKLSSKERAKTCAPTKHKKKVP